MKCSAERLIRTLVGVEMAQQRKAAERHAEKLRKASYVVTVSRGYGSQGREVAQALAGVLGVNACDREILDAVARRAVVDVELVAKLDETVQRAGLKPWNALFAGASLSEQRYYENLVKVVMNITKKGGVIIGRGAHLILGPAHAFRVRIVGSLEQCAARIAGREQVDLDTARLRVLTVNRQRAGYLQQYFGADPEDESVHDLVLNSDRFSIQEMVSQILLGMQLAGYDITDEMLQRV